MFGTHMSRAFHQAHRYYGIHQRSAAKALQRLSSGKRINSAADDPAGLAVSQKMRSQIRELETIARNSKDEILMYQTAEGGLNEVHSILQKMHELAALASNGTLSEADRALVDQEYQALMGGIDGIYSSTKYNGNRLLNKADIGLQNAPAEGESPPGEAEADGKTLRETNLLTQESAMEAMKMLECAIHSVSATRAGFGAQINVLDYRINYLESAGINAEAALSNIEDADMALEMMNFTKASLLMQVSQAAMMHAMHNSRQIVSMLLEM